MLPSNDTLIFLIKALHTSVFAVVSVCVLYVLLCGWRGRASRRPLLASIAFPVLIGVLWLLNGHECVLSSLIYRLANGDRSTSDIFLPVWFARWIMLGTTLVLLAGSGLVLWRTLTRRWKPASTGRRA